MNRRIFLVALIGLLVVLVGGTIVAAQTSTSFDLSWYVLAGGGERAAGTNYALNGTLGQAIVGISDDTGFQVHSGYWYGVWPPRYRGYLPLVMRSFP
jgi:hypothetical protein